MARLRGESIRIEGIVELDRKLKAMESGMSRELTKVNKTVARVEADNARSAAYSLGSTAAHVAPSLKASAGAQFAAIAMTDPAAAGAEFGGRGKPTTQQFQPWRGSGPGAGYFLYPTLRRDKEKITDKYYEGVEDLKRRTGLA